MKLNLLWLVIYYKTVSKAKHLMDKHEAKLEIQRGEEGLKSKDHLGGWSMDISKMTHIQPAHFGFIIRHESLCLHLNNQVTHLQTPQ